MKLKDRPSPGDRQRVSPLPLSVGAGREQAALGGMEAGAGWASVSINVECGVPVLHRAQGSFSSREFLLALVMVELFPLRAGDPLPRGERVPPSHPSACRVPQRQASRSGWSTPRRVLTATSLAALLLGAALSLRLALVLPAANTWRLAISDEVVCFGRTWSLSHAR